MVRKYLRAERKARGWNQADLARAAGIRSKTTIVDLEAGRRLSEGSEGAIETAVGWEIGSLDEIRAGGRPILAEQPKRYPRDPEKQEVWDELGDYFSNDERAAIVEEVIRGRRGGGNAATTSA